MSGKVISDGIGWTVILTIVGIPAIVGVCKLIVAVAG